MAEDHRLYVSRRNPMRRLVRLEPAEPTIFSESRCRTRKAPAIDGFGVRLSKPGKGSSCSITQCGNCGGEVKVFVSPRRNPHSNKLGRAVSMKDHDLCRRCWRRVMQQQRKEGVIILPLSMFIGGTKLRPRLLISNPGALPREAS